MHHFICTTKLPNIGMAFGVTVFWEIVIIADMGISEPGGGFGGRVGTLEGCLKIFDKVWEGSKRGGV